MLERINLVPKKPLAARIRRLIPLLLAGALALIAAYLYLQNLTLEKNIAKNTQQIATMQETIKSFQQLRDTIQQRQQEIAAISEASAILDERLGKLEGQERQKIRFSVVLADLAAVLPPSIICNAISFSKGTVTILGTADGYADLPDFIDKLKQSGHFRDLSLQAINKKNNPEKSLFNFQLTGIIGSSLNKLDRQYAKTPK